MEQPSWTPEDWTGLQTSSRQAFQQIGYSHICLLINFFVWLCLPCVWTSVSHQEIGEKTSQSFVQHRPIFQKVLGFNPTEACWCALMCSTGTTFKPKLAPPCRLFGKSMKVNASFAALTNWPLPHVVMKYTAQSRPTLTFQLWMLWLKSPPSVRWCTPSLLGVLCGRLQPLVPLLGVVYWPTWELIVPVCTRGMWEGDHTTEAGGWALFGFISIHHVQRLGCIS